MRKLIVNNISIISPDTEKAKYQEFKKGINVVIGDKKNGNFIGKSSLLRSIFHTLGADSKYNKDDWEKEGPYIYILDFKFDDRNFVMLRKQELFKLYEDNQLLFTVINREQLAEQLTSIFLDEIFLLNYDNQYSRAQPVYSYLLNYIEQTEIKLCDFRSFNGLTAFPKTNYSDLLYELVGSNSKEYNDSIKLLKVEEDELVEYNKKNEYLRKVLEEIIKSNNTDITTDDIDLLKKSLKEYELEYSELTSKASKYKNKIYEAHTAKAELEIIINELKSSIKDKTKINERILKDHTCPTCQSELNDSKGYFSNSNNINNYTFQLVDLEKDLANIERQINLTITKYEENIIQMKELEARIFRGNDNVEDQLSYIGLRQIKNNVNREVIELNKKIDKTKKNINNIKKIIRSYKKTRKLIDKFYVEVLTKKAYDYQVRIPSLNKIKTLSNIFKSDGNEVMLTTVTWLTSLLETKYKFNVNSTVFPLIYDNPNNANLDETNDAKIFRLIFDSLPQNGQIISSSVGFDEELFKNYKINAIKLDNEKYNLLNKEDFIVCSIILSKL